MTIAFIAFMLIAAWFFLFRLIRLAGKDMALVGLHTLRDRVYDGARDVEGFHDTLLYSDLEFYMAVAIRAVRADTLDDCAALFMGRREVRSTTAWRSDVYAEEFQELAEKPGGQRLLANVGVLFHMVDACLALRIMTSNGVVFFVLLILSVIVIGVAFLKALFDGIDAVSERAARKLALAESTDLGCAVAA